MKSEHIIEDRKPYVTPTVDSLGSLATKTQSGTGDTDDGSDEPPQSFFSGS